ARLMYNLLQSDLWHISQDCPRLIECLPTLVHGEAEDIEDVVKVDWTPGHVGDDPYDSARYGLKSYLHPGHRPLDSIIEEQLVEVANTNAPMLAVLESRIRHEHKQDLRPTRLFSKKPKFWRH